MGFCAVAGAPTKMHRGLSIALDAVDGELGRRRVHADGAVSEQGGSKFYVTSPPAVSELPPGVSAGDKSV